MRIFKFIHYITYLKYNAWRKRCNCRPERISVLLRNYFYKPLCLYVGVCVCVCVCVCTHTHLHNDHVLLYAMSILIIPWRRIVDAVKSLGLGGFVTALFYTQAKCKTFSWKLAGKSEESHLKRWTKLARSEAFFLLRKPRALSQINYP
jgi:hypothetical protein